MDLSTPSSKDLFMRQTPAIHRLAGIRPGRFLRLVGMLASLSVAGLGLSAAPALAEDCPNAALRAENNSTRLPECRAYEMVTPLYKEGFPVNPQTYTADGDAVAYESTGNFAGNEYGTVANQYVAARSASGWSTTALNPSLATYFTLADQAVGFSADLRSALWVMKARDEPTSPESLYVRGLDGVFTRIGSTTALTEVVGASADLSHMIFRRGLGVGPLYEFVGTENQGPPSPVGVDNTGAPTPEITCGGSTSVDVRVIVFTSGCIETGAPALWARVGGTATVAVSASECTRTSGDPGGACNAPADANLAGMAADGSRVFFTTTQQLVNGDTDQTNDLYECDIPPGSPAPVGTANPCASLTEVSGATSGANVESVVHVSEDGSRVYFVATGVRAINLGTEDAAAVAGNNNLYVWEKDAVHPVGQTTFVAKLEANDIFGPQTTADGRYLVFSTASRLLASDTDEAYDMYRYDAETGSLLRLSTDTNGSGGNEPGAQALAFGSERNQPHTAMSDDASTVVFETAEALSPGDTDGTTDVYEWHEGQVSLISNGGGGSPWITGSGRDIFFRTNQPLTPGDSGTEGDVYDARIGGGFPVAPSTPCSGEACQGAPALQPQPPGTSASTAFNGPGNPLAAETPPANQPKPKPKPATAAQKLANALKSCRSEHNKKKRTACEKQARNTYRRAK